VPARSVDAALRRSIPAFNRDVKDVQNRMEDVSFKLRIPQRKPWQGMAENVQASLVLARQPDKVCCLPITFTDATCAPPVHQSQSAASCWLLASLGPVLVQFMGCHTVANLGSHRDLDNSVASLCYAPSCCAPLCY